MLDLVAYVK